MELTGLSEKHKVATVALVEAVAMADGNISEGESDTINRLATALGDEAYRGLLDEAERMFPDLQALKAYLQNITNAEERDLIFGTVLAEVMSTPATVHGQSAMLQWLAETWGIQTEELPDGVPYPPTP